MKKIVTLWTILAVMLFTASALAQTPITVSGTGEVRLSADTAVISLGVNARDKDVLKAQQKVNESIAAIRKALIEKGVKEENINTEFMNIYAMYDYREGQEELTAYNASSTLAIKVTDMDAVGKLIDLAFSAGANTLNGISFSATDTSTAKEEALRAAVEDAQTKAAILAEASGMTLLGIDEIRESNTYTYDSGAGNFNRALSTKEDAAAGTVIQAAKIAVTASIVVSFKAVN